MKLVSDLLSFITYRSTISELTQPIEQKATEFPTFSDFENTSDTHIVWFFADWCFHCKQMQSLWNEIKKMPKYNHIIFSGVDCQTEKGQTLCRKYEVSSFPTIKLFQNGVEVSTFEGVRDETTLQEFVDKGL